MNHYEDDIKDNYSLVSEIEDEFTFIEEEPPKIPPNIRSLLEAILERAERDLENFIPFSKAEAKNYGEEEVTKWFKTDDDKFLSFLWICKMLDIDYREKRKELKL